MVSSIVKRGLRKECLCDLRLIPSARLNCALHHSSERNGSFGAWLLIAIGILPPWSPTRHPTVSKPLHWHGTRFVIPSPGMS